MEYKTDMQNKFDSLIKFRDDHLSPHAIKSRDASERSKPEDRSRVRTEFQRDRDRIIHSNAFRRLKHKTQVFIAPTGDHYVTRMTHTLEVSQISSTIARALNLNEDLVEAIALGHDLGHTPFGHLGEEELNELHPEGYRHAEQSVRIVEYLEKNGQGLNLTWEVKHGMRSHSKPKGDIMGKTNDENLSLEAQIVRISDAIAYLNHDIGDAIRAGVLNELDLPQECRNILGSRHSERIDTLVTDIITSSWAVTGQDPDSNIDNIEITMSPQVSEASNQLRDFMFQNVYLPEGQTEVNKTSRQIVRFLYNRFVDNPDEIPAEYHVRNENPSRMATDYVSGMTDYFAIRLAEQMKSGIIRDSNLWKI